jgi:hypothetical protein
MSDADGRLASDRRRALRAIRLARLAFALSIAVFLAFAADMATRPVNWLVVVVPDDAFYYLQIARHLATSGHSTLDGINPTNGYHPGWMALLTLTALVFRQPESLLRAALGLSLALHLVASLLLARTARRVLGPLWGWTAGLCWLWNPLPLGLSLQAMETSLLLAAVSGALLVFTARVLPARAGLRPLSLRDLLAFGASLALVVLARTDMLVVAACAALAAAYTAARAIRPAMPPLRAGAVVVAVPVAALLPWWAFCGATVGTVVQDSADMKALWAGAAREGASVGTRLSGDLSTVFQTTTRTFETLLGPLGALAPAAQILAAIVVTVALARRPARAARLRFLLAWLGGATLLMLAAYGLVLSLDELQIWYTAVPGLTFWLAMIGSGAVLGRPFSSAVAATAGAVTLALGVLLWDRPNIVYPWQRDVLRSLRVFETQIPVDARVGCFNAGVPAYFGHRLVINLDGLVNHAVHPYWREHRFQRYLQDAGIGYIADEEDALNLASHFSDGGMRLAPVAATTLTGWPRGRRILWRVQPASVSTQSPASAPAP